MPEPIKILLLEDNRDDIVLIFHALKKDELQFIGETAETKIDFEKKIIDFSPDIILSDFSLPSFDGLSAFEIKEHVNPQIPFIIISGTIGEENAVNLIKRGVTDYVIKDKLFSLPGKIIRALRESKEKREKQSAEHRLKENQERLAEAQRIAKMGNWEIDLKNGLIYWCDEVYDIFGLKPNEIVPSLENFFSFFEPEKRKEIESKINNSKKSEEPFTYSAKITRNNGSVGYVYVNGQSTFENNNPVRINGILQDVTDTKRMEEELKAANKELETFIYRASHDLRGPLSSIIGLMNVSKTEITDETSKKYFQMVEASALKLDETLISLVQSMTMRDMIVNFEEIDPENIVSSVLSQLKFHEGFSKVKFILNNNLSSKILSNKLILSSVFQNIIQNAIKYQDYHKAQSCLEIIFNKKDNGIEIIFDDNGIGIEDNLQSRIFDMYFRGTTSVSGTGLGLYIVKIGIEKLKGTIQLHSSKGKGSRFTIFLPYQQKD
jgi:two-component system sensor histidine kinase UhpB